VIWATAYDYFATWKALDGGIFGPPPGGRPPARFYLAGAESASRRVADLFTGTLAQPVLLQEQSGQASALKMAFASFQRTSRTADDHDVTKARRMPSDILANRDYLPSVADRAWRCAPEMREVASTLTARQLPSDLATATAEVLQRWADATTDHTTDPATALQHLHGPQEPPHGAM